MSAAEMEDYTNKYKGEQVEIALFGGEYQDGVLTAYCYARGRRPRRAERAHPDPAPERRLPPLLEPLRRARSPTGRRAASPRTTRTTARRRGLTPAPCSGGC